MPRKTTPKVRDGRVQKKDRHAVTPDGTCLEGTEVILERRRAGPGYRHLLTREDLERFIALLPDWDELADGLGRIVLDAGEYALDGWHAPGQVGICAWERDLWIDYAPEFVVEHAHLLERLEVETHAEGNAVIVHWTEATARAYQLMHVLLHELGHHHDRMTTRSRRRAARGEPFAETYALEHADALWQRYSQTFLF